MTVKVCEHDWIPLRPVVVQTGTASISSEGDITMECGFCGERRGPEANSRKYHPDSLLTLLIFRERLRQMKRRESNPDA